ncbi:thiolase family protein [Pseudonocardia sp. KRD-184]|uniref:Thiolase family protein n=1 Tax=Pseudonocardia oceani TaxID=2792013 RepID=A0ABS6UD06_9PSEU|nr:thiolase family protein [Pseudonocardia oceani]MBW0092277.1 thiolase family protein [Pseudonocardia oceani]MBW0099268.1 thiolase family protein [Pseudonocardia oceani]MBW0111786.1 thiolase family protein [Pseudonocardia oceani]MBW0125254.1 thiolase family protein [Pseudonocardia oceani]MBW0130135.1 thiolase family protein [Pseudonocardia oceani]
MNQAMVWGVGTSDYGLFPERRVESLAWEAVAEAVRDAGISPGEIDAIVVGSVFGPPGVATRVQRGLGIPGVPMWTVENACASSTSAFHEAVEAVRFGRFGCVLVLGVDQMSTLFSGAIVPEATDPEGASSLPLPGLYALAAQRYVGEFGVTPEQLAAVAVKNKRNGLDNPRAQLRTSVPTAEEVLASRMIAEPLTMLQCCPTSDGAGAAIVGGDRGNRDDLLVEASAMVSGALWDHRSDDVWGYASVTRAAEQAFGQAGRTPDQIDVMEVHDAFTIGEILTLEALGIAPRGKGAELAPAGHTTRDGAQPVNPSGGLLSRGHPLGATGTAQIAEVVWQLRGRAGPRQVARHAVGLVETMGGGAAGMDGNACVVTILSTQQ